MTAVELSGAEDDRGAELREGLDGLQSLCPKEGSRRREMASFQIVILA